MYASTLLPVLLFLASANAIAIDRNQAMVARNADANAGLETRIVNGEVLYKRDNCYFDFLGIVRLCTDPNGKVYTSTSASASKTSTASSSTSTSSASKSTSSSSSGSSAAATTTAVVVVTPSSAAVNVPVVPVIVGGGASVVNNVVSSVSSVLTPSSSTSSASASATSSAAVVPIVPAIVGAGASVVSGGASVVNNVVSSVSSVLTPSSSTSSASAPATSSAAVAPIVGAGASIVSGGASIVNNVVSSVSSVVGGGASVVGGVASSVSSVLTPTSTTVSVAVLPTVVVPVVPVVPVVASSASSVVGAIISSVSSVLAPASSSSSAVVTVVVPTVTSTSAAASSTSSAAPTPTNAAVSGWRYAQGIQEGTNGRALVAAATAGQGMTVETCLAYCDSFNYPLAGLEYGAECYCGTVLSNGASLTKTAATTMSCAGNPNQICGGPSALSLYVSTKANSNGLSTDLSSQAVALPAGWASTSCIQEVSGRALVEKSTASDDMTIGKCLAFCGKDYKYAGLEYGRECYCGNTLQNGASLTSTSGQCVTPCAGMSTNTCGGPNALQLYTNANYKPASTGAFVSGGCVQEVAGRALRGASTAGPSMTIDTCTSFCASQGFKIAGLEYGQECYCDNAWQGGASATNYSGQCNMPCAGNSGQNCGGPNAINFYTIG